MNYPRKPRPCCGNRTAHGGSSRVDLGGDSAEFYNTLTTNCTTAIWMNDRVNPERVPLNWKIVASGYLPEYLYEEGRLEDAGLPFVELQRRAHINALAIAADSAADFSRRIRTHD